MIDTGQALQFSEMDQANKVYLGDDGVLYSFIYGDQTEQTVAESDAQSRKISSQLVADGKPVLYLVDLEHAGRHDWPSRRAGLKALQDVPYDKMAVVNASPVLQAVINFLAGATGHEHKIRLCASKAEALQWLHDRDE